MLAAASFVKLEGARGDSGQAMVAQILFGDRQGRFLERVFVGAVATGLAVLQANAIPPVSAPGTTSNPHLNAGAVVRAGFLAVVAGISPALDWTFGAQAPRSLSPRVRGMTRP